MKSAIYRLTGMFLLAGLCYQSVGMEFEKTRMVVWRRGETIAGEEFVAANEAVADYLATLERPTDLMKGIRYECQIKSRWIRPQVQVMGGSQPYSSYVNVTTVYDIKDCKQIN